MAKSLLYYLAYGSNLHPVRLRQRVPSARLVGVIELRQYRLAFHKKGRDGSSKCDVVRIHRESDCVYGAIYGIDAAQKAVLDRWEGRGNGYQDSQLTVELFGKEYCCFMYLAEPSHIEKNLKPYHWYKELVLLGATYLNFPETYVHSIEAIESMDDQDEARRTRHDQLIEEILNFSPCGSEPSYD